VIEVAAGRPLAAASQYSPATTKTEDEFNFSSKIYSLQLFSTTLLRMQPGLDLQVRQFGPNALGLGFLVLLFFGLLARGGIGLAGVTYLWREQYK
jgi:hypothetical protein